MRRFVYPVDTDQFADIRKDGKVYVDKTDMVYDLVNRYNMSSSPVPAASASRCYATPSRLISKGRRNCLRG